MRVVLDQPHADLRDGRRRSSARWYRLHARSARGPKWVWRCEYLPASQNYC